MLNEDQGSHVSPEGTVRSAASQGACIQALSRTSPQRPQPLFTWQPCEGRGAPGCLPPGEQRPGGPGPSPHLATGGCCLGLSSPAQEWGGGGPRPLAIG